MRLLLMAYDQQDRVARQSHERAVIKRDVLEGEKFEEAKKKIAKSANKVKAAKGECDTSDADAGDAGERAPQSLAASPPTA